MAAAVVDGKHVAMAAARPAGTTGTYTVHPEVAKFPHLYHSTRDATYPTPSAKWQKLKSEVEEKKLALTMLETYADLRNWQLRTFRGVLGLVISETCGWCGTFVPEFLKLVPTLASQIDKKDADRLEFVVFDQYFRATEALKEKIPALSRVQIDAATGKPRLDPSGREICLPVPSRGFPTIFAMSGNQRDVHILIRLAPRPNSLPAGAPRPELPNGVSQETFLLGQMAKKLSISVKDVITWLTPEMQKSVEDIAMWEDTRFTTTSQATFAAFSPPKNPPLGAAGTVGTTGAPHPGVIAPAMPTVPVPPHLQKLPEIKWFFKAERVVDPVTLQSGNTLQFDNIEIEFEYHTNPDHRMTPLQGNSRLKFKILQQMGIPFRHVSVISLVQTPTVEITLWDLTTGMGNTLRYRGGDAFNFLGGLEANLRAEFDARQSDIPKQNGTPSRVAAPPIDE